MEHERTVVADANTSRDSRGQAKKKAQVPKPKKKPEDQLGEDSDIEIENSEAEEESMERELQRLEDAAMNPREAMLKKLRRLKKLQLKYHPDRYDDKDAATIFSQKINAAMDRFK